MNHQTRVIGSLERRIRDAERDLFAAVGADVDEFFLELAQTGLRVRVLSHGRSPADPVVARGELRNSTKLIGKVGELVHQCRSSRTICSSRSAFSGENSGRQSIPDITGPTS